MNAIGKSFFLITICVSLILVHMLLAVFDANIYNYLFWPYVVSVICIVIFAVIVFYKMDKLMNIVGPDLVLSQYKKIIRSTYLWLIFVLFTFLLYIDIYSIGQLFLQDEQMSKIISGTNPILGWLICITIFVFVTCIIAIPMRVTIMEKSDD